jgi:small subunit ribosomal protein S16
VECRRSGLTFNTCFSKEEKVAVKIRLKKMGRTHRPFFRVCAMDQRSPRDGRVIEQLGTYDPMVPDVDARAILNGERIKYWLSVGAQATPKVGTLIKKYGSEGTHLEVQATAVAKLSGRRATAIESARTAASKVEMPKTEPEPKPEEAAEATAEAPAAEAAAEAPAEAAAEAPAKEAPAAEAAPAEEAPAEAAAEEAKAE